MPADVMSAILIPVHQHDVEPIFVVQRLAFDSAQRLFEQLWPSRRYIAFFTCYVLLLWRESVVVGVVVYVVCVEEMSSTVSIYKTVRFTQERGIPRFLHQSFTHRYLYVLNRLKERKTKKEGRSEC